MTRDDLRAKLEALPKAQLRGYCEDYKEIDPPDWEGVSIGRLTKRDMINAVIRFVEDTSQDPKEYAEGLGIV